MSDIDVFISHATGDKDVANVLCLSLERQGLRCWLAERDLKPGMIWLGGAAIDQAIQRSRSVVVVFTRRADRSSTVAHELTRATAKQLPVLAVRLGGALPSMLEALSRGFEWTEAANPPTAADLQALGSLVSRRLGRNTGVVPASSLSPPGSAARSVFVSAKSSDYQYARQIYDLLVSHNVSAFFSDETLPDLGSSDYRKEIDRALDASEHMVVVTSSVENVLSPWVEAEWGFFINEKRSGRKPGNLITVLAAALPPASLPPSLRQYQALPLDPESYPAILRYVGVRLPE